MDKQALLEKLPPFTNTSRLIESRQSVKDIIREVLEAHSIFAADYDLIALDFACQSPIQTARALFNFCKQNIRYKIEPEARQTTKSPGAILALGDTIGGDCKHYAGFIGGVLDALNRAGCKISWNYRFASYDMFDPTPQHVFIVVKDQGQEIWVDPVLDSFNQRLQPYHTPIDRKPKTSIMPLFRLSGVNEALTFEPPIVFETQEVEQDENLTPELEDAIRVLLYYGVMTTDGKISDQQLNSLSTKLNTAEFDQVTQARQTLQNALSTGSALGNVFQTIWRGIKKVSLLAPRNAYLSLVALNVFGYGTKLANAIYKADGSYFQPNQNRLYEKWSSFGGDWKNLENAIKSGAKKTAILGTAEDTKNIVGVAPAAVPAWVATASAIIAMLTPLIKELIAAKQQAGALDPSIDPSTGLPYGLNLPNPGGTNDIMSFIQSNPIVVIGAVGIAVYLLTNKKHSL
jgi:hypothetical protein